MALLDSHVHLWPAESVNRDAHAWMTPNHPLACPHELDQYQQATHGAAHGFVYIETDRSHAAPNRQWQQPLDELRYVVAQLKTSPNGHLIKAVVAWAPLLGGADELHSYLKEVKTVFGPEHLPRLKGFRYLLQGLPDLECFERIAANGKTLETLCALDGFTFDVGIDARSGGVWQMQAAARMIQRVRQANGKVTFIINHMCKPDFGQAGSNDLRSTTYFELWAAAIEAMGSCAQTYMKLSGALTELGPQQQQEQSQSAEAIWLRIAPWVRHVFNIFGPRRIMFGSDWPVCNMAGMGEGTTWQLWMAVVEHGLKELGCTDSERLQVLGKTAQEAYGIDD